MQKADITPLVGGLDLITPAISVAPGRCIAVANYEITDQGTARCEGYERYDGQKAPSAATYSVLEFDAGQAAISAGDTVTGASSGATGIALYDAEVETGTYGGSDATGFLVLYCVTGTFADDENLQVSAATKSVANGTQAVEAAATDTLHNTYLAAVRVALRSSITTVPGSGNILGVHLYKGDVYAFRNNAGATACVMHKASAAGWVEQTFGTKLNFGVGTTEFVEEETLTGGTSGHTATIKRIIVTTGDWSSNDAAGYVVLSGATGVFQNSETVTSASGSATANGTAAAITLAASGRVRCINHNFYGSSNLERMYGVTSTGRAFEWDGTTLAPISTGLSDALDKPKFVGVHANHLLLGYDGGAVMHSSTGLPLNYFAVDGAGELGIGADITGIISAAAKATVFFSPNSIHYLTGSAPGASGDFLMEAITREAGAKTDSAIMADQPIYLDNQGVRKLSTSQAFGDWKLGTLSRFVHPYLQARKSAGATVVGAMPVKAKDQYRLVWDDSEVLVVYLGGKDPEITSFTYSFTPTCAAYGEDTSGNERIFCGTSDGYVMELDKGLSFDGGEIAAYIRYPWRHQGAPNMEKRYHGLNINMLGGATGATLQISVEYSYADDEISPKSDGNQTVPGQGGIWDTSTWDEFYWDSRLQVPLRVDLDAIGENMSYAIISEASDEAAHILSSDEVWFSQRRMKRRKAI